MTGGEQFRSRQDAHLIVLSSRESRGENWKREAWNCHSEVKRNRAGIQGSGGSQQGIFLKDENKNMFANRNDLGNLHTKDD